MYSVWGDVHFAHVTCVACTMSKYLRGNIIQSAELAIKLFEKFEQNRPMYNSVGRRIPRRPVLVMSRDSMSCKEQEDPADPRYKHL